MRTARTFLQNISLSFFAKVAYQLGNALLFFLIARKWGPEGSGIYALAVKYTLLFLTISSWGLESLVIWQISTDRSLTPRYFVNYGVLRLLLCCIAYSGLVFTVNCTIPYNTFVRQTVFLVGLGLIPEGINRLIQAFLVAHGQFSYPAIVSLVIGLMRCFLGGIAVCLGKGLELIASIYAVSPLVGLGIYGIVLFARRPKLFMLSLKSSQARFDIDFVIQQMRTAAPFALAEILYAIDGQIDAIILALYLPQEQIGFYSAAQNIVLPLSFAFYAYDMALFPWIARLYTTERSRLWSLYRCLLFYTALILLPVSVLISGLARPLIEWVYTDRFAPAAAVLPWLLWSMVIYFFNEPNSRLIIVAGYSKVVTIFLGISTITNVFLNSLLVPKLGIMGSGGARLLSSVIFTGLGGAFAFCRVTSINPVPIISKPILAAVAFGLAYYYLSSFSTGLGLLVGGLCYFCVLFLTRVVSSFQGTCQPD